MFTHLSHALLALTTLLPAQTPPKPAPPRLELDEIVRDRMSIHDAPIHTPTLDTYYVQAPTVGRRFTFEAPETRRYEISHISYFYDSYLTVRTPDGKLLAENDDGPVAGHALLAFNAEEGNTYIIEAAALRGHAGPYELLVRQAVKAPERDSLAWRMDQYVLDEHRRLAAYEAEYGEYYAGTLLARANVGAAYFRTFQRADALTYFQSALVPHELTFGPSHKNLGVLLDNIALAAVDFNDYALAEDLQRRAIQILRKLDPPPLLNLGRSYHNLGRTLVRSGQYAAARDCFEDAFAIRKLSSEPTDTISTLAALAITSEGLGDLHAADQAIRAAVAMIADIPESDHVHPSINALRIAQIQHAIALGDIKRARATAANFAESLRAAPAMGLPLSLSILASCCYADGDYDLALSLQKEALALHTAQYGPHHIESLKIRQNMAVTLTSLEDLPAALEHAQETTDLAARNFGPIHPITIASYETLAETHHLSGNVERAIETTLTELNHRLEMLLHGLPSLPEHERLLFVGLHRRSIGRLISLAIEHPNQTDLEAVYEQVLIWKGLVSRGLIQDREWLRRNSEKSHIQDPLAPGATSGEFFFLNTPTHPRELREQIGEDEAILDFIVYLDYRSQTERIACFISTEESLSVLDLESSKEATRKITFYTDTILESPSVGTRRAGEAVHRSFWIPISAVIGSRSRITVNPDGPITQLPFAALQDGNGRFLVEYLTFSYCDSFVSAYKEGLTAESSPSTQFLLVGGVDYESAADTPALTDGYTWRGYRGDAIKTWRDEFQSLPGSMREIEELEELFKAHFLGSISTVLKGKNATEGRFRATAPKADIIHVATHGFYASRSVWSRLAAPTKLKDRVHAAQQLVLPSSYDFALPGLMSGLALAGANTATSIRTANEYAPGFNDGFMTAEEISWLDLSRCKLAVLSACDSGRGKPVPGEHLLGLRRSLRLAGVQSSMTSLWRIDDGATSRLMIDFYTNLWVNGTRLNDALRQAQISAVESYRKELGHGNPAAWGGFVIEGSPSWERR